MFFWFVTARAPIRDASNTDGDRIVPQLPRTFILANIQNPLDMAVRVH